MRKILYLFIFILIPVNQALAENTRDEPGQLIRVGVFANPPVAFKDENGRWRGISIDVLQAIANDKGWKLEFVPDSFSGLLKKFDDQQIDLICMMAFSELRAKKYIFTRNPLISNWGLLYTRTDTNIASLLDLEGKRVSVMRNNIHDKAFRKLTEKFALNINIVELANFSDVMESVRAGGADAGVANRLFGALHASDYGLVETGIIFNPINIHYAILDANNSQILDEIDQQLSAFKADKNSVYFDALNRWMNQSSSKDLPQWLIWLSSALFSVLMLMLALTVLLKRQVAARTIELQLEVDERRLAQDRLDYLAYYDSLTKLPNKLSLLENLKLAIASTQRRNNKSAVLFIDIDRFKTINDSLGHNAGDQLIVHVAQRLHGCLREGDTINRFGGDEFVGILQDIYEISDINYIAKRMLKSLSAPIDIGVTEIYSSVSIGIAVYPDDDDKGDNLLKYADAAMYHAKAQGGNNYQFYNAELTQQVQKRLSLETRLRHALERNEFQLYYQPIFNLADQEIIGVEALIRWNDPGRGLISPDDFIPLAEETGLIIEIGEWVIEHACAQVREWQQHIPGKLLLAVNVASRQFDHNKLQDCVLTALHNSGLSAQQLELEITERMFLNISNEVRKTIDNLTNKGVKFSIDDFGTGYSSLSYLKQLPIDTLKIDRSFIMGIPGDKDDMQIASTIVSMAHGLGMNVIAEGIETANQLNFLRKLGCVRGQGFYLSEPLSADNIINLLNQKKILLS